MYSIGKQITIFVTFGVTIALLIVSVRMLIAETRKKMNK